MTNDPKTQKRDPFHFRRLVLHPSDALMEKLCGIAETIPGHAHNYLNISRSDADTAFRPWLRPRVDSEDTLEWWVLAVAVKFEESPSGSPVELAEAFRFEAERWLGKQNEKWEWCVSTLYGGGRFEWRIEVRDKCKALPPDPIEFVDVLADLKGVPIPTLPDFDFGFEME